MSFHYLLASIELSVQLISSFLVGLIAILGLQSFVFPSFCRLFRLSSCFFCVHLNTLLFSNLIDSYLFWTFLFLLIPETKCSYSQREYAVLSFPPHPLKFISSLPGTQALSTIIFWAHTVRHELVWVLRKEQWKTKPLPSRSLRSNGDVLKCSERVSSSSASVFKVLKWQNLKYLPWILTRRRHFLALVSTFCLHFQCSNILSSPIIHTGKVQMLF